MSRPRIIDGTYLKLLAALLMLIDHIGVILFPDVIAFRIIGRLSFPIFAFMISEGAKYTKNKLRYFLLMFLTGVLCQIVFYIVSGSLLMCILITFSASVLMIYLLDYLKACLFSEKRSTARAACAFALFVIGIALMWILNYHPFFRKTVRLSFDAGFFGFLAPIFASLFVFRGKDYPEGLKRLDTIPLRVLCFSAALIGLIPINKIQWVSLFAIIPLLLYSEKRGRFSLKYFFYLFYPLHLAGLWLIFRIIY